LNMTQTQDGLAMLTDTSYVVYNSKGGELTRRQHGFSSPIFKTAGKWTLIAEAGGSRLRIETRASTTTEMTLDNNIIGISMGENGNFALATDSSQGYTSEVVVYDRHKADIYHWYSSDLTVVDVALSTDGQSMVVAGIMAQGGAMKSSLLFFDFDKQDPVAQYTDTDLLLFSVRYFTDGTVAAVGDQALRIISEDGSIQQKQSYDDHNLIGYTVSDDTVSVILHNYGSTDGGLAMTVNSTGEKAFSASFEGAFRSIAPCRSGILLLTSEHLYRTNAAGIAFTEDVIRDGRLVSAFSDKAAVLGLTSLNVCTIPAS